VRAVVCTGQVLGRTLGQTVYPLTLGVAAFSIGVFVLANTVIQRHGEPAPRRTANALGGSTA